MRPRGTIRSAIHQAFVANGPATWRTAAEVAQVGYDAARHTVGNMVRAGELVRVGSSNSARAPEVRLGLYGLPGEAREASAAPHELLRVMQRWSRSK